MKQTVAAFAQKCDIMPFLTPHKPPVETLLCLCVDVAVEELENSFRELNQVSVQNS